MGSYTVSHRQHTRKVSTPSLSPTPAVIGSSCNASLTRSRPHLTRDRDERSLIAADGEVLDVQILAVSIAALGTGGFRAYDVANIDNKTNITAPVLSANAST